jgi:hypothetical protein
MNRLYANLRVGAVALALTLYAAVAIFGTIYVTKTISDWRDRALAAEASVATLEARVAGAQALAAERSARAEAAIRDAEAASKASQRRARTYATAQPSNPSDLCASADALVTEALLREKQ